MARRAYYLPHPILTTEEAVFSTLSTNCTILQTNLYLCNGIMFTKMHPTVFPCQCQPCEVPGTFHNTVIEFSNHSELCNLGIEGIKRRIRQAQKGTVKNCVKPRSLAKDAVKGNDYTGQKRLKTFSYQ